MSKKLAEAVDQLPEMKERQRRNTMHLNMSTRMMTDIKERELDKYFEVESTMILKNTLSSSVKTQTSQSFVCGSGANVEKN